MHNNLYKVKLKDILSVKRGASLSGQYYATEGDKIRLTLGNFNYPNGGFKENTSKENIYFTGPVRNEYILHKGDIITPLTEQVAGLLGETARIPVDNTYIQSGDIGLIIPKEDKLYKGYAYYLISSKSIKYQLGAAAQQTKIRHTSPEKIENCIAWIPNDLVVQKNISDFLDNINNKIILNNKINQELEQMAKTLYDYWFVQFDFPDEKGRPYKSANGKMVYNEVLKREIPENWTNGKLSDISDTQTGYAFKSSEWKDSGHPVLTIKAIENNSINMSEASYIENYKEKYAKYSVSNGNIILAMTGNTIGKIGIIASDIKNVLINQRVCIYKTNYSNIAYLYFNLLSEGLQKKIWQIAQNSSQPNVSEEQLNLLPIVLPPKELLNKYNEKFSCYFKRIVSNNIENQQLSKLRNFLLPLLMNGQVTVNPEH